MNWLQKISQVNYVDIINLVMSGGSLTPAMQETLMQNGTDICGELNANISIYGGVIKQRLINLQKQICSDENMPNTQPNSMPPIMESNPSEQIEQNSENAE